MATYYLATFALIGITTLFDLCLTRWDWFLSYQNAAPNQGTNFYPTLRTTH
jgi:hypothetical protein